MHDAVEAVVALRLFLLLEILEIIWNALFRASLLRSLEDTVERILIVELLGACVFTFVEIFRSVATAHLFLFFDRKRVITPALISDHANRGSGYRAEAVKDTIIFLSI